MRDSTLSRLAALAADESTTFMDAALMVNICLDEDLDEGALRARLLTLTARSAGSGEPWTYLAREGFGGRVPSDVVAGSRMDAVLDTRRGLPITLAALVVHLAGSAGMNASGINFPGHFLAKVSDRLIDPVTLTVRSEAECLAALPAEADRSRAFDEACATDVLIRMFNNLKYYHAARAEFHRALEMVDCQLQVLPDLAGLVFEHGEYWLRLGSVQGARLAYERIIAGDVVRADGAITALARQRLDELGSRNDTLH